MLLLQSIYKRKSNCRDDEAVNELPHICLHPIVDNVKFEYILLFLIISSSLMNPQSYVFEHA